MPSVDSIISEHMIRLSSLVDKSAASIHLLEGCLAVSRLCTPWTDHSGTNQWTVAVSLKCLVCLDLLQFCLVYWWLSIICIMEVVEADISGQRQGRPWTPELLVHSVVLCINSFAVHAKVWKIFFLCSWSDLFTGTMMMLWELDRT